MTRVCDQREAVAPPADGRLDPYKRSRQRQRPCKCAPRRVGVVRVGAPVVVCVPVRVARVIVCVLVVAVGLHPRAYLRVTMLLLLVNDKASNRRVLVR